MIGTDPSPASLASFEHALQSHAARMFFYNSQVTDPTTANMRQMASRYHVPVVGLTEMQPRRLSFARWQLSQLERVQRRWK